MLRTFHVRGASRDDVVRALRARLADEGYVEDASATPPPFDYDAVVRQLVVREEGGWVSVLDHPFAKTAWAERLSGALGVPVVKLAGEADHVFFSEAVLAVDGEIVGESHVPKDAVLGSDGRHRIFPLFLAEVVPETREALEAGVVVNSYGGEGDVVAVGKALGIAKPQVGCSFDDTDEDDVVRITVRRDASLAEARDLVGGERPVDAMEMLQGLVGSMLGLEKAPEFPASWIGEDGKPSIETFLQSLGPVDPEQAAAYLAPAVFLSASARNGIEGEAMGGLTFEVSLASTAARVRGLDITLSGDGLALLDPIEEIATFPRSEGEARITAKAERIEVGGREALRFRLSDFELRLSEARRAAAAKPSPLGRLFGGAMNMGMAAVVDPPDGSRMRIMFEVASTLPRVGTGTIEVHVELGEVEPVKEGEALEMVAQETTTLEVRPRPRVPVLPAYVDARALPGHDLEAYAGRGALSGWIGFGAPWSDVASVVTAIAKELLDALRAASGLRLGSVHVSLAEESLTFEHAGVLGMSDDETWRKVVHAIAPGGDVRIQDDSRFAEGGHFVCVAGGEEERPIAVSFEIRHRKDGGFANGHVANVYGERFDFVRVAVAWAITKPLEADAVARIVRASERAVSAAGRVAGNVGGYVLASADGWANFDATKFERLLGVRADKQAWCAEHVRTPAWCVLAPTGAAPKLPSAPPATVSTEKLPHGVLVRSAAADPFVYAAADAEAMERFVLGAMASAEEIEALRRE